MSKKRRKPQSTKAMGAGGNASLPMPGANTWNESSIAGWNLLRSSTSSVDPSEAEGGRTNAVVAITVNWISTSWQVATPQVGRLNSAGKFTPDRVRHPYLDIIETPNSIYSGSDLTFALIWDFATSGNSYEYLERNRIGQVIASYWLPAEITMARADSNGYLMGYEYRPDGKTVLLHPDDVIHYRYGIDPHRPLMGRSPLGPGYREIITDNAYSDYAAGLAKHGGVPPVVFSPKVVKGPDGENRAAMSPSQAKQMGDKLAERFTEEPGKPKFLPGGVDMHQMAFKPDDMALNDVRAMPETRIPALLGISALVLELWSGLQKSNYSNKQEASRQSWRGGIIPLQRVFASARTAKILKKEGKVLRYDTTSVPELAEDMSAKRKDARDDFAAGMITLEEARAEGGRESTPEILAELAPPPMGDANSNNDIEIDPKKAPKEKETGAVKKITTASVAERNLYRRAAASRSSLASHEDDIVSIVSDAYAGIQTVLDSRLEELITRVEEAQGRGEVITETWLRTQERYQQLSSDVREALANLAKDVVEPTAEAQLSAAETAEANAEPLARAATGTPPAGVSLEWNRLPVEQIQELVSRLQGQRNGSLANIWDTYAENVAEAIEVALVQGVGLGENPRDVAAKISRVSGMARARAETIARTEMLAAAREASRASYVANSDVVSEYVRLCATDTRVCAACWALHGTKYPTDTIMPTHPNCRCVMAPVTKSWAQITGDDSIPDTRPVIESGPDLFAKLPESKQRVILGAAGYDAYSTGTPLSAFAVESNHDIYGPSLRVATVGDLNQ